MYKQQKAEYGTYSIVHWKVFLKFLKGIFVLFLKCFFYSFIELQVELLYKGNVL